MNPSNCCRQEIEGGWTLWLTGLPCAGKSTLAKEVAQEIRSRGHRVEILDADVLRTTLCRGLRFSKADRDENVARIGWACQALNRHGVIAIAAVISPYGEARERLRVSIPNFIEVYVKAPLRVCVERDVKGMYGRALRGEMSHFTGVDDPYEEPLNPDIVVETDTHSVLQCAQAILHWLENSVLDFAPTSLVPTKRSSGASAS